MSRPSVVCDIVAPYPEG